jgi:hypothetical protein
VASLGRFWGVAHSKQRVSQRAAISSSQFDAGTCELTSKRAQGLTGRRAECSKQGEAQGVGLRMVSGVGMLRLSSSQFDVLVPASRRAKEVGVPGRYKEYRTLLTRSAQRGGEDTHAEGPPGGAEAGGSA